MASGGSGSNTALGSGYGSGYGSGNGGYGSGSGGMGGYGMGGYGSGSGGMGGGYGMGRCCKKKYVESSYRKLASSRVNGPDISTYPAGFFVEDFTYVEGTGDLDEHNGRFAATPEFPNGVYAYYSTVNPIQVQNANSPFDGVRTPTFPYIIGDTYYSDLQTFNTSIDSTQDLNPVSLGLVRNTKPYNIGEYEFVPNANKNTNINSQIVKTKSAGIGKIDVVTAGKNYNVGYSLVFDNVGTGGFGAIGKVSRIEGPDITTITSTITTIPNVVLLSNGNVVTAIHTGPHGISNNSSIWLNETLLFFEMLSESN